MFNFVELFAGCGGTTLGLKAAGFDLLFANEISPMAGETFSYNILNEDLEELSDTNVSPKRTLWLSSQFPLEKLEKRLRENPAAAREGQFSDVIKNACIYNKLIIGDICDLVKKLKTIKFKSIDLLSGGPPCQAFSLAGRRDKNDSRNNFPLHFVEIAAFLKPRVVVFENVEGILSPFTDCNGYKFYTWFEVAKFFALKGYIPICLIVNTKKLGIPQNRPRFIMMAFRQDELRKYLQKQYLRKATIEILKNSQDFYNIVNKLSKGNDFMKLLNPNTLNIYNNEKDEIYWDCELFPGAFNRKNSTVTVKEAIDDLKYINGDYKIQSWKDLNDYPRYLLKEFKNVKSPRQFYVKNHQYRQHSNVIKSRFKLLQVIENSPKKVKRSYFRLLEKNLETDNLDEVAINFLARKRLFYLCEDGKGNYDIENRTAKNIKDLLALIDILRTRKFKQLSLNSNLPALAQLTIPDDFCHYDRNSQRTLTVREISRIQTFPDWFVFKSKTTTGGDRRKYEVPQYSQVGNAVPPILAKLIGERIKKYFIFLER